MRWEAIGLRLARLGGGWAVAFSCAAAAALGAAPASATARPARAVAPAGGAQASLQAGYSFLAQMMDRYASGSQLRLVQSYSGGVLERRHFTASVTYDDALIIDALLARGTAEDLSRAQILGEALLYVQANDPAHDGRVRAAYEPTPLTSAAVVLASDPASDVGNMAWVGQALVQLYAHTAVSPFLAGALQIGEWIQQNAYDTRGSGGYTGGQTARGSQILWKSTEHNIDVFSFFELLAAQTGQAVWHERAQWAKGFVASMWNAAQQMFFVGSDEDGVTINSSVLVEDVNSWSYLALREPAYAGSLDWESANLAVSRRGFSGVSFCTGDRRGVWFEGTSHLADALALRNGPGDAAQAQAYLADVAHAQASAPHNDGLGIVAASKNGLRTCEGERFYASLHTGATAWYLLALLGADPFVALP
jgi:hypothetical protein